jgi:hypothetical protein
MVTEDQSLEISGLHGTIFNVILFLVWCHVAAVGFYLLVKGDNLIRPMLTGRKPAAHVPHGIQLHFARPAMALLIVFLIAGLLAWVLWERLS